MYQSGYFHISNDVFNFNFLALVVSEKIWSPKFTSGAMHLGGHAPPGRPPIPTQSEYFSISTGNGVFNFNFLALVVSEIFGVSQNFIRGISPLNAPSGIIFVPKAGTLTYLMAFLILTF